MPTCNLDNCKSVERVRLRMAVEGVTDDLERCRACRWLRAYQQWLADTAVREYKEVDHA